MALRFGSVSARYGVAAEVVTAKECKTATTTKRTNHREEPSVVIVVARVYQRMSAESGIKNERSKLSDKRAPLGVVNGTVAIFHGADKFKGLFVEPCLRSSTIRSTFVPKAKSRLVGGFSGSC